MGSLVHVAASRPTSGWVAAHAAAACSTWPWHASGAHQHTSGRAVEFRELGAGQPAGAQLVDEVRAVQGDDADPFALVAQAEGVAPLRGPADVDPVRPGPVGAAVQDHRRRVLVSVRRTTPWRCVRWVARRRRRPRSARALHFAGGLAGFRTGGLDARAPCALDRLLSMLRSPSVTGRRPLGAGGVCWPGVEVRLAWLAAGGGWRDYGRSQFGQSSGWPIRGDDSLSWTVMRLRRSHQTQRTWPSSS